MWLETKTVLPIGGELPERLAHRDDPGRVEAVRRLVEEEEPRVAEERGGDPEPLLHPERVGLDLVAGPIAQPDELEQLLDPRLLGVRAPAAARERRFSRAERYG